MAREEALILKKMLSTCKNHDGIHSQVDHAASSETAIKGSGKEAGDGSYVYKSEPSEAEDARFASAQHLSSNKLAMSCQIDTKSGDFPMISSQNLTRHASFAAFLCFGAMRARVAKLLDCIFVHYNLLMH